MVLPALPGASLTFANHPKPLLASFLSSPAIGGVLYAQATEAADDRWAFQIACGRVPDVHMQTLRLPAEEVRDTLPLALADLVVQVLTEQGREDKTAGNRNAGGGARFPSRSPYPASGGGIKGEGQWFCHPSFWLHVGSQLLGLPLRGEFFGDPRLLVAQYEFTLQAGAPPNAARPVQVVLKFYQIRDSLQLHLRFSAPTRYLYRGRTAARQVRVDIPHSRVAKPLRFEVNRCGLIEVRVQSRSRGSDGTRLSFHLTPAGSVDWLSSESAPALFARFYKGGGRRGDRGPVVVAKSGKYRVKATQVGTASWYGPGFHGRRTSSGERFDMNAATAAHRTLPLGTRVRVTNLRNGRSAIVRINDRGPFVRGRIIDVSRGVARRLGFHRSGTVPVKIEVLEEAE